jgi:hypothetical protein
MSVLKPSESPLTAADYERMADYALAQYQALPEIAKIIFTAKRSAHLMGAKFVVDPDKMSTFIAHTATSVKA